jgi:hypothetical protein
MVDVASFGAAVLSIGASVDVTAFGVAFAAGAEGRDIHHPPTPRISAMPMAITAIVRVSF